MASYTPPDSAQYYDHATTQQEFTEPQSSSLPPPTPVQAEYQPHLQLQDAEYQPDPQLEAQWPLNLYLEFSELAYR